MRRKLSMLILLAIVATMSATVASAHECNNPDDPSDCHKTPVAENWRDGNYIPLFDITDREDEDQRSDAQRWREECAYYDENGEYQYNQFCVWADFGQSFTPDGDGNISPNEVHVGGAGTHCFLGEFAHQCQGHNDREGTHDAHGGTVYADICLTENPESKYCDDGMKDTQVGATVMDHNPCGIVVPIAACTDEYHVIRPFDQDYTQEQMEQSFAYMQRIIENPHLYLCGYDQYGGDDCIVPKP